MGTLCLCRVILEELDPDIDRLLADHNQEAVDNLVAYITTYIYLHAEALPPGNVLPLSGFAYPPLAAQGSCAEPTAALTKQLPLTDSAGMSSSSFESEQGSGRLSKYGRGMGALQVHHKTHHVSSPFVSLSGMGAVLRSAS